MPPLNPLSALSLALAPSSQATPVRASLSSARNGPADPTNRNQEARLASPCPGFVNEMARSTSGRVWGSPGLIWNSLRTRRPENEMPSNTMRSAVDSTTLYSPVSTRPTPSDNAPTAYGVARFMAAGTLLLACTGSAGNSTRLIPPPLLVNT